MQTLNCTHHATARRDQTHSPAHTHTPTHLSSHIYTSNVNVTSLLGTHFHFRCVFQFDKLSTADIRSFEEITAEQTGDRLKDQTPLSIL